MYFVLFGYLYGIKTFISRKNIQYYMDNSDEEETPPNRAHYAFYNDNVWDSRNDFTIYGIDLAVCN